MTLKFAATGLGVLKSRHALDEVRAMSRTGDPAELLRGPLLYGVAFCALTRFCWRSVPGVAAMMALCMGDGLAEVFGRIYGRARLPWSPTKSWAGSAAFLLSAVASSAAFAELFRVWGWSAATTGELVGPLVLACAAGCAVESLPLRDVNNLLVPFVVAAILSRLPSMARRASRLPSERATRPAAGSERSSGSPDRGSCTRAVERAAERVDARGLGGERALHLAVLVAVAVAACVGASVRLPLFRVHLG